MEDTFSNVAHYITFRAKERPRHVAIKIPLYEMEGHLMYTAKTFEELENETNVIAQYFIKNNVQKGTKVLLAVKPGYDLIAITFALFKIGAVPVVIDPGMGLINFLKCVRQVKPDALVGISLAISISRLFVQCFWSVKKRIPVKPGKFLKKAQKALGNNHYPVPPTEPDDLAAILFTSGSTGAPKGVEYKHRMFAAQVELIRQQYGISPGEVDLPLLPIFALFNPALGMCTVVPPINPKKPAKLNPAKIVDVLIREEVTNSFGSPVLWDKISAYCIDHNLTLPYLKRVLIAGAPTDPELAARIKSILPNGDIHTPYGATEALPMTTISGDEILDYAADKTRQGKGFCVGKVFPGVSVQIIDPRGTDPLVQGQIGEIAVKGPSVTEAYYKNEAKTRESKVGDWHRMGDLGYVDHNDNLWVCGRKAELVCDSHHRLFYPACCEAIFNQHPWVYRSALIAVKKNGTIEPGIVLEFENKVTPAYFDKHLRTDFERLADSNPRTEGIRKFFVQKDFPVDVRHNAKIHRLTLSRKYSK